MPVMKAITKRLGKAAVAAKRYTDATKFGHGHRPALCLGSQKDDRPAPYG